MTVKNGNLYQRPWSFWGLALVPSPQLRRNRARPVKGVIQQMVENEIALGVLKGDFKEDDTVLVDVSSAAIAKGLAPQRKLVLQRVENRNEELVAND